MFKFLSILLCLSLSALSILTRKVVKVTDGDTITILVNNKQVKIRLNGIDAPEKGQDYSNKAKEYLSDLVDGKTVKVEIAGKDQYNRILGVVYVGKVNVNEEMIKAGYAWRYKYNKDSRYLELQNEAKRKKKGLWSGKDPVGPWQWRKDKKGNKKRRPRPPLYSIQRIIQVCTLPLCH